jgi:flagellin
MMVQNNLSATDNVWGRLTDYENDKQSTEYKAVNEKSEDDAVVLSEFDKMRKEARGLTQKSTDVEDGISSVQTADDTLSKVTDTLQRLNELAIQAADDSNTTEEVQYIQDKVDELVTDIDRKISPMDYAFDVRAKVIASNDMVSYFVNIETNEIIRVAVTRDISDYLGVYGVDDTDKSLSAALGIDALKSDADGIKGNSAEIIANAIEKVSSQRLTLGEIQNSFAQSAGSLDNVIENKSDDGILDMNVDAAAEMVTSANANILAQADQSVLAQANQSNRGVLSMLG